MSHKSESEYLQAILCTLFKKNGSSRVLQIYNGSSLSKNFVPVALNEFYFHQKGEKRAFLCSACLDY